MRTSSLLVIAGSLSLLSACGGDGEHSGTGGASANAGADAGGAASTGGKTSGGASSGGSVAGSGVSLGGGGASGGTPSGGSGAVDMSRVATAHKIKRRFSLGDSNDSSVCLARAEGGVLCTIATVGKVLLDQQVDLVTMSGLGYCAILDGGSVTCANATSDSAASKAFAASVTSAATLMKDGSGLMAVDAAGDARLWNGEQELSAKVAPGSMLGGRDFDVCALAPDGKVACFTYIPGSTFDKAQFDFANTKYADIAQSLLLFAGITLDGKLRVRYELEDKDKVYTDGPFVQVAANSDYWCMLSNTGTLRCDGYQISQSVATVPSGEFLAVDVNEDFACAVRPTGELVCWGDSAPTVADKVRLD